MQVNYFAFDVCAVDFQNAEGGLFFFGGAGAGVKIQNAVYNLVKGFVGMPENNNVNVVVMEDFLQSFHGRFADALVTVDKPQLDFLQRQSLAGAEVLFVVGVVAVAGNAVGGGAGHNFVVEINGADVARMNDIVKFVVSQIIKNKGGISDFVVAV